MKLEGAEGVIVRNTETNLYHVKIIRIADGRFNISKEGFETAEEAKKELFDWIKMNGGQVAQ